MPLCHAAKIVRRHMFDEQKRFTGFQEGCQRVSVPNPLLALVNMVLEGPCKRDQSEYPSTSAALTIAQQVQFNSARHMRREGPTTSANIRDTALVRRHLY